jgi:hypothetical protein
MMDGMPYVIAAYAITWVVMVGYGLSLWRGSKTASSQRAGR